jgi:predicted DsbA family dithiol-disulfide isomerase
MKVEIWSDVICPFCYIGKRRFENALGKFGHKDKVEIIWHSFELDPERKSVPEMSIHKMLAEKKGWSVEQAKQMNDHVTEMASEVGLKYDFDKAIPVNTFNAHRISHLAAKHNVQNEMEELLFSSYFTKGVNIDDENSLIALTNQVGIDSKETEQVLKDNVYSSDVRQDEEEAREIGINGVPFFVFDRKYAISGAQPEDVFIRTLEKVWEESKVS